MARPFKADMVGQSKEMKFGYIGTIVKYNSSQDIDVLFENGYIAKNIQYNQFVKGNICNYKRKKTPLLGDELITDGGYKYKIIEFIDKDKIKIQFQDESKYIKIVSSRFIRSGRIESPFFKNVYGAGYYGGEFKSGELNNICYNHWHKMIERCYNKQAENKYINYNNCTVSEEWLNYYNFCDWFEENYYILENDVDRMNLDKDILIKGNKIYSPNTCVFVPARINKLFTKTDKNRGLNPIGVTYNKRLKKYIAQCSIIMNDGHKQQKHLGIFLNKEDAFYTYKKYKEKYIKQIAEEYKNSIPSELYNAMYKWEVEIDD